MSYGISGSDNNTWTYVPATGQKYRWSDWTGVIYRAQLTGLLPGIYDYQCSSDNSSFSAVHTFRVQDWVMTSGGSWTFGFTADVCPLPRAIVYAVCRWAGQPTRSSLPLAWVP